MTSWLGVTSPRQKGGSFLIEARGFLVGLGFLLEDGFCDFLFAIFVVQKFTGEEVRDGVLASFNIFDCCYLCCFCYSFLRYQFFVFSS